MKTKANVKRLIRILAQAYEENPKVVLREMVQNAADAITSAKKLNPEANDEITIEILGENDRTQFDVDLAIRDQADGMDRDEFEEYLATLGAGSKVDDLDTIGEFGIGFYSLVVVCISVIIATKRREKEVIAYNYLVEDDEYVELDGNTSQWLQAREFHAERESGTTVFLRINFKKWPQLRDWLNRQRLETELRTFCLFIPYPISVHTEETLNGQVLNITEPPWLRTLGNRNTVFEELWSRLLPYTDQQNYPNLTHCFAEELDDRAMYGGVFYFVQHHSGGVQLYGKDMYVQNAKDMLPPWADSISAVVNVRTSQESPIHLTIPPARTHIVRNDAFMHWITKINAVAKDAVGAWYDKLQGEVQAGLASVDQEQRANVLSETLQASDLSKLSDSIKERIGNICLDLAETLQSICADPDIGKPIRTNIAELLRPRIAGNLEIEDLGAALNEHGRIVREKVVSERRRQMESQGSERPTWHPAEHEEFVRDIGDLVPMDVLVKEYPHGSRPQFTEVSLPIRLIPFLDPSTYDTDGITKLSVVLSDARTYLFNSDERIVIIPRGFDLTYLACLCQLNSSYVIDLVSTPEVGFTDLTYEAEWHDLKRAFEALVSEKSQDPESAFYVVRVKGYEVREFPLVVVEDDEKQNYLTINAFNGGMKSLNDAFKRCLSSGSKKGETALRWLIHDLYHTAAYECDAPVSDATRHLLEVKERTLNEISELISETLGTRR